MPNEENVTLGFQSEKWQWNCPINAPMVLVLTMLAQLQLALRHPQNTGPAAQQTRAFCKDIAEHLMREIPEDLTPIAVRLLGWPESFGVEV